MVLSEFPFPMTVTMVQLTSITVYSGPFFNLWGVRKYSDMTWRYYFRFIVPLALGKFLASVTSHISIWKVPVSYAHTGKYQLYIISHRLSINTINNNKITDPICDDVLLCVSHSASERREMLCYVSVNSHWIFFFAFKQKCVFLSDFQFSCNWFCFFFLLLLLKQVFFLSPKLTSDSTK